MSQDRFLFVPWNKDTLPALGTTAMDEFAYDAHVSTSNRQKTHHERKWTIAYLDTPNKPLKKIGMGVGTRLNVTGHGAPNDTTLYPPQGATGAALSADQVAAALEAQGLPKRYVGTVVCDVCDSANGKLPFAKALARALWKQGYKATCVMGHTGVLTNCYFDGGVNDNVKGKYLHRVVEKDDGTFVKSKDAQIRFFGFT